MGRDRVIDQPRRRETVRAVDAEKTTPSPRIPSRVRTWDKLDAEALRVVIDIERDRFVVLWRGLSIVWQSRDLHRAKRLRHFSRHRVYQRFPTRFLLLPLSLPRFLSTFLSFSSSSWRWWFARNAPCYAAPVSRVSRSTRVWGTKACRRRRRRRTYVRTVRTTPRIGWDQPPDVAAKSRDSRCSPLDAARCRDDSLTAPPPPPPSPPPPRPRP